MTRPGLVWLGCVSLMPRDNTAGMRADTLALIKRLAPPITRWPGGNFVSGYNWKDGVGERDRRPPRWERAWNDVEDNDFGIDEWGIVRDWNSAPDAPGVGSFEHYYLLGDAIAAARALHEMLRSSDVVAMANWAQAVNVIGTIKRRSDHAALDPVGHVLALYRGRVNGAVVPVTLSGDAKADVVATWDHRKGRLALGLVNYSPDAECEIGVGIVGARANGITDSWQINGPALDSINVPGKPEGVTTSPLALDRDLGQPLRLPPHSITVIEVSCR